MTPGELAAVRGRLEEFAAEMFAPLVRRDQRDKGATYVRGLLLDGRRKSMQPMAERLGVDHQGLQQFVSSSTWAVEPVRKRLARRAVEVIAPEAWVVDDTGYGDIAEFRDGLNARGRAWVMQVQGVLSAHAEGAVPALVPTSGRGRPARPRYRTAPVALREHVLAAGRDAVVRLTWRTGSRGSLTSFFVALRVRPAGHHQGDRRAADGSLPAVWLLAEWPPEAAEPTDYWLSCLPADTPLAELVRLAKIRWRIEHDYRELKTGLGLDHFEGRTWTGWHRHVTLVTAAQLFLTLLRTSPKAAAPA